MRGKGHRDDLTDWHGDSLNAQKSTRAGQSSCPHGRRDGYATREYAHTQPHTALLSTAELLGIDASSILAWLGILRNKN